MICNATLNQILGFINAYRKYVTVDENDHEALAEIESDIEAELKKDCKSDLTEFIEMVK